MIKIITLSLILTLSTVYASTQTAKANNNLTTKEVTKKKKTLSGKKLVVFVSSGDLQKAGMGFGIALSGVKQGADVTIVIGAGAVKYALKENEQNIYFAKEKTPRELLKDAVASGAIIMMCSANTEQMELESDDFIEGTKLVISPQIFAKVFEEGARVISF